MMLGFLLHTEYYVSENSDLLLKSHLEKSTNDPSLKDVITYSHIHDPLTPFIIDCESCD